MKAATQPTFTPFSSAPADITHLKESIMKATIKVRFQRFAARRGRRHVAAAALVALTMATSPVDSQPPPRPIVYTDSTETHYVPFDLNTPFLQNAAETFLQSLWGRSDVDVRNLSTRMRRSVVVISEHVAVCRAC